MRRVATRTAAVAAVAAAFVAGQGIAGAQSVESPALGTSRDTRVPRVTLGAAASTAYGESGRLALLSVQLPISRFVTVEGEFTRSAPSRWQLRTSTAGANILWRAGTPRVVGFVGGGIGVQRSATVSPFAYLPPDERHGVIQQLIGGVDVPFAQRFMGFAALRASTAPEDGIKAVAGVRVSLGSREVRRPGPAVQLSAADQGALLAGRQVAAQGKTVRVTRVDGSRRTGKLVSLSASEVVIRSDTASVPIPLSAVHQVERVTHYASIGAGIGAASMLMLGVAALSDCSGSECGEGQGYVFAYTLMFTGVGAAIGAIANAATRDGHLLYRRPGTSASVRITPILGRGRAGVGVAMQW